MAKPRVLIIDPTFAGEPDVEHSVLAPEAYDIEVWAPRGNESVPHDLLATADAIVNCRSKHKILATSVAAMAKARIVVQSGVGFNHIDLEACGRRGIPVCNTPDYGTMEVADHAIALMLALMRGIATYNARLLLRDDAWGTLTLPLPPVRRLRGQVFGVVGLGRIGTAAMLRARAFEMRPVFYDPYVPPGTELALGVGRVHGLAELMALSDVVSVHCPLNVETANLIDDAAYAAAKPGLILINTSRGGVVDLDATERALRAGRLCAAGLDVLPVEPLDRVSHPLLAAWSRQEPWLDGRLLITPHAAFFTPESLRDMRRLSAQAVLDYLRDGRLRSCVNLESLDTRLLRQGG